MTTQRTESSPPMSLTYTDPDSVHWRVYERDARGDPGAHGHRCLIFSSGDVLRRVWHYPENWRELSSVELTALSWKT